MILDVHKDVLRIPSEAILEGNKVLVYKGNGMSLEERDIKTGLSNWKYTEIVSGLNDNERVVTSIDREGIKAGVPVVAEQNSVRGPSAK